MLLELFPKWLQHFAGHTKDNTELPILDNHISHCTVAIVVFYRETHTTLLSPPPHASHKLQPLDKELVRPLKAGYSQGVDKWLVTNPGKAGSQGYICSWFVPCSPHETLMRFDDCIWWIILMYSNSTWLWFGFQCIVYCDHSWLWISTSPYPL